MLLRPSELRTYADPLAATSLPGPVVSVAVPASGEASFIAGRHGVDLAAILPLTKAMSPRVILSDGTWSLHDLLEYLYSITGPASLTMTSWGITAEPLKRVRRLQDRGLITSLTCLFDRRVRTQCPEAHQLLLGMNAKVHLGVNHSKILIVQNDEWSVTVITSANLTVNHRLEGYVVLTDRNVAVDLCATLDQIIAKSHPFDPVL